MIQWVGTSRLAELTWRRVQSLGSTHKAGHNCTQTCDSGTRGGGGRSIARAWWLPSRLHHQWEALSHQGKKEKRDIAKYPAPSSGICSHSYTHTYAHTPHIQATLTYTACTKYKTNKMAITTRSLSSTTLSALWHLRNWELTRPSTQAWSQGWLRKVSVSTVYRGCWGMRSLAAWVFPRDPRRIGK